MRFEFFTLDVFTDQVFGGNPLGVFPHADGLDDITMQRVAREMNLSETVFLFPPKTERGTREVRIFTPATEVPFAGHPTVGTAFFLAATGAVELGPTGGGVVLEERVGPVDVEVSMKDGVPQRAVLTAAVPPEYRPVPWSAGQLAQMISVEADEIGFGEFEPEMVSFGLSYIMIPVSSLAAAQRCRLDSTVWGALTHGAWSRKVYVVAPETEGEGVDLHVRMFAPAAGVPEDPATGSAAAALGAYLGKRAATGTHTWLVEQGLEIGRPSLLTVESTVEDGSVTTVRVGGSAVMVSQGSMEIPL